MSPSRPPALQVGAFGGIPGGGLKFGTSHNAAALVPTSTMIDFYNGGGVDMACLGMAEVSQPVVAVPAGPVWMGICQPDCLGPASCTGRLLTGEGAASCALGWQRGALAAVRAAPASVAAREPVSMLLMRSFQDVSVLCCALPWQAEVPRWWIARASDPCTNDGNGRKHVCTKLHCVVL